ncbi:SanA/YdcF family protein [Larsenimonas rhizosphaerae]|uniref:YdcF family protein n=1 Tax=Larsenimonas rhizosphaerae TaxID=2944682 RepID=A0AA42CV54_9GAMM|nr:ElyC/SanA/YdcF family protein [Larsenimonas rhizosphaerae]MCM2132073.1 YdcF family protein [Larsenimonas rhizosphaerae]MCX2524676.1 YdcF family protein [Larsenimonas rhizosphaerae]
MKKLAAVAIRATAWSLMTGLAILAALNAWVILSTRDQIHTDILDCPPVPVGIVFGTSYGLRGGGANPHFHARMNTAAQLYRLGLVDHLLLSGDNRTRYYNEPRYMWRDLHRQKVPDSAMTLDFAGFSTFDTLVRAQQVFKVDQALLVTQSWHLPRALFIADQLGMNVQGCVAHADAPRLDVEMRAREWLARAATVGDLYLWHRRPHFLGPTVPLTAG